MDGLFKRVSVEVSGEGVFEEFGVGHVYSAAWAWWGE